MPSGVYPEVTFPRIAVVAKVPGPRRDQHGAQGHAAAGGGRQHRPRRRPGALQDDPRRQRAVHRLRPRHRHAAGPSSSPGTASAPSARELPPDVELDRRADDAVGLPHHVGGADRRRQPGPAARLRLLPAGPAHQEHPRRALRQRGRRRPPRDRGRSPGPTTCWPPACPPPTSPTRSASPAPAAGRPHREPAVRLPDPRQQPGRNGPPDRGAGHLDAKATSRCASATWPTSRCCTRTACSRSASTSKDAVVITVFRRLGGNTVNISHDVHALLDRTPDAAGRRPDKPPPRNIQATVVYDQATFVETAVDNVRDAILIGGLFSILILLAFLRSWRATLISALAIPTTLAITFLFLHWTGETLNLMSLGGLAVAIGLIIDDTVVVIENIARHLAPAGGQRRTRRLTGDSRATPQAGGRSRRRRVRRDHRRRRRLDADDGAGVRAAGVHRRRLRPVLRLAELVAVDRRAGVDGHQPDAGAGVRGQVPGRPADAGAGADLPLLRRTSTSCGLVSRPALPVADAGAVGGGGRRRRGAVHGHPEFVRRSRSRASRRPRRWSRASKPA